MSLPWCRLWADMPADPKWRTIAKRSGCTTAEVIAVFVVMMTKTSLDGVLEGWDDEDVAALLDLDAEFVGRIRQSMQGKVLDGETLTGWSKRQPKRDDRSTERVRAFRERQRNADETVSSRYGNGKVGGVTHGNAPDKIRVETDTEYNSLRSCPPPDGVDAPVETNGHNLATEVNGTLAAIERLKPDTSTLKAAVEAYNAVAVKAGWAPAKLMNDARRTALRKRIEEAGGLDGWIEAMERALRSTFLRNGDGKNTWRPDLGFFLQLSSFTKLLEGSYDDRKPTGRVDQRDARILAAGHRILAERTGVDRRDAAPPDWDGPVIDG